jgi:hypothetical protein
MKQVHCIIDMINFIVVHVGNDIRVCDIMKIAFDSPIEEN